MFTVSIDIYTLIGISIIVIMVLIIATYMFIAYIIHDGRKFNSINKYNESALGNPKTYNEVRKDYDTNVKKSGVNHDKKSKLKIFKRIVDFLREVKK